MRSARCVVVCMLLTAGCGAGLKSAVVAPKGEPVKPKSAPPKPPSISEQLSKRSGDFRWLRRLARCRGGSCLKALQRAPRLSVTRDLCVSAPLPVSLESDCAAVVMADLWVERAQLIEARRSHGYLTRWADPASRYATRGRVSWGAIRELRASFRAPPTAPTAIGGQALSSRAQQELLSPWRSGWSSLCAVARRHLSRWAPRGRPIRGATARWFSRALQRHLPHIPARLQGSPSLYWTDAAPLRVVDRRGRFMRRERSAVAVYREGEIGPCAQVFVTEVRQRGGRQLRVHGQLRWSSCQPAADEPVGRGRRSRSYRAPGR